MSNRETRALYQKLSGLEITKGPPSINEGDEGSMTIRWVSGKGLYIYVKYGNKWYSRSLLDKPLTVQEELNQTVVVQTLVETERTTTNELDVTNRLSLASSASLSLPTDSVTNTMLDNATMTIGNTVVALGGSITAFHGVTSLDVASAADFNPFATIGANTLTLGRNTGTAASSTDVTVGGDLTVGGDFDVGGTSNVSLDSSALGTFTVQKTSTTALKVGNNDLSTTTIIVDSTNRRLGINKTPSYALDIDGDIRLTNDQYIYGITSGGANGVIAGMTSSNNINIGQSNTNNVALNLYGGTGKVNVFAGSNTVAVFDTNARLGVGGSHTPSYTLDVAGDAYIQSSNALLLRSSASKIHSPSAGKLQVTGQLGIGGSPGSDALDVTGSINASVTVKASPAVMGASSSKATFGSNATDVDVVMAVNHDATSTKSVFLQASSGHVGIGDVSPHERLTVTGGDIAVDTGRGVRGPGGTEQIVFDTTDGIELYSGNSQRVWILTSGNVGIGATPSYPLEVTTADENIARFKSSDNRAQIIIQDDVEQCFVGVDDDSDVCYIGPASGASTGNLNISSSGKVGIGTTSPNANLEIADDAGATLTLSNTPTSQNLTNESLGILYFSGYDTTITTPSTKYSPGAAIQAKVDGAWDNTDSDDSPTQLRFYTQDSTTSDIMPGEGSDAPRMTIKSDGNVGIGVTDPDHPLEIKGANSKGIKITDSSDNLSAILRPDGDSSGGELQLHRASGGLKVEIKADGRSFFNGGYVGIGTDSPGAALHIEGTTGNIASKMIIGASNDAFITMGMGVPDSNTAYIAVDQSDGLAFGEMINDHDVAFENEWLRITNAGNVGIGTNNPSGLLHLKSTADSSTPILYLENSNDNALGAIIKFFKNPADDAEADDDTLGTIQFSGQDSDDNVTNYAEIVSLSQDVTAGAEAGSLTIYQLMAGSRRNMLDIKATPAADTGYIIFNEDGRDVDFIVESDTNTHALFVEGSTSNVGINSSTPKSPLHVKSNSNSYGITIEEPTGGDETFSLKMTGGGHLQFEAGVASDLDSKLTAMTIKDDGMVGIGAVPTSLLHLSSAGSTTRLLMSNTDATSTQRNFDIYNNDQKVYFRGRSDADDGDGAVGDIITMQLSDGFVGIGTASPQKHLHVDGTSGTDPGQIAITTQDSNVQDNDSLGYIWFGGTNDASITGTAYGAAIKAEAAGTWGNSGDDADEAPAELQFFTQDASTTTSMGSPRMVIDRDGKVGIGITGPSAPLHVKATGTNAGIIIADANAGDAYTSFGLYEDGTRKWSMSNHPTTTPVDSWQLLDDDLTARITVTQTGLVGIGTSAPAHAFHIRRDGADRSICFSTDSDTPTYTMGVDETDSKFKIHSGNGLVDASDFIIDTSGNVSIGTLNLSGGSITDTSGTINLGDDNLTTTGVITAGSFSEHRIGDLTITQGTISTNAADSDITLDASGNDILLANDDNFKNVGYTSGLFAGDGFAIYKSGSKYNMEVDNLWVRNSMHVYEFIINKIRATNGSLFVSSAAKCTACTLDTDVNGDGNIDIDDYVILTFDTENATNAGHPFADNDIIIARSVNTNNSTVLTSYKFQITDNDPTANKSQLKAKYLGGTNDAALTGLVDQTFVRVGNTSNTARKGGIYLTSDDSNSPFIDVFDGVDSIAKWDQEGKVMARVGKLDGITAGGTNEYGIWAGSGQTSTTDSYIKASGSGVEIHGGTLKMYGSGTEKMRLAPSPYIALTDGGVGANGGMDATTNTGTWISPTQFRTGNPSGTQLFWSGSDLFLKASDNQYTKYTGSAIEFYDTNKKMSITGGNITMFADNGSTAVSVWNDEVITLGKASQERLVLSSDTIGMFSGDDTQQLEITNSAITVGGADGAKTGTAVLDTNSATFYSSANTYSKVSSTGLDIYLDESGAKKVASFGSKVTIGRTDEAYIEVDASQIEINDASDTPRVVISATDLSMYDEGGIELVNLDTGDLRLGAPGEAYTNISSGSVSLYSGEAVPKRRVLVANDGKISLGGGKYVDGDNPGVDVDTSTKADCIQIDPGTGIFLYDDANNYAKVSSSGLDVIGGGNTVATFAATTYIGRRSDPSNGASRTYLELASDAIKIKKKATDGSGSTTTSDVFTVAADGSMALGTHFTVSSTGVGTYSGALTASQINAQSGTINTIVSNQVDATYINALTIEADTVKSDWVYAGTLTAAQISGLALDIGGTDSSSWHVDSSGNMWWGSAGNYGDATIKISSSGSINMTTGTFSGTLGANMVDTSQLVADAVTANEIEAGTITATEINSASITADVISTGSLLTDSATISNDITIGSSNDVFKASSSGIQLGHATFGSAPFRVTKEGALTATSGLIAGWAVSGTALTSDSYSSGSGGFSGSGIKIDSASQGTIEAKNFAIDSSGNASFKGDLTVSTLIDFNQDKDNIVMGPKSGTAGDQPLKNLEDNSNYKNNIAIAHGAMHTATVGADNIAIGVDAGKTMGQNITTYARMSNNIALGTSALKGMESTYAYGNKRRSFGNVAIGTNAMGEFRSSQDTYDESSGSYEFINPFNNVAIGSNAGKYLSGAQNICIGDGALSLEGSSLIGQRHSMIAIGTDAFKDVGVAQQSIAIGHNAGKKDSGESNDLITSQGIYIGTDTQATHSVAYEIVVGTGATGKGANTAFIKADSGFYTNEHLNSVSGLKVLPLKDWSNGTSDLSDTTTNYSTVIDNTLTGELRKLKIVQTAAQREHEDDSDNWVNDTALTLSYYSYAGQAAANHGSSIGIGFELDVTNTGDKDGLGGRIDFVKEWDNVIDDTPSTDGQRSMGYLSFKTREYDNDPKSAEEVNSSGKALEGNTDFNSFRYLKEGLRVTKQAGVFPNFIQQRSIGYHDDNDPQWCHLGDAVIYHHSGPSKFKIRILGSYGWGTSTRIQETHVTFAFGGSTELSSATATPMAGSWYTVGGGYPNDASNQSVADFDRMHVFEVAAVQSVRPAYGADIGSPYNWGDTRPERGIWGIYIKQGKYADASYTIETQYDPAHRDLGDAIPAPNPKWIPNKNVSANNTSANRWLGSIVNDSDLLTALNGANSKYKVTFDRSIQFVADSIHLDAQLMPQWDSGWFSMGNNEAKALTCDTFTWNIDTLPYAKIWLYESDSAPSSGDASFDSVNVYEVAPSTGDTDYGVFVKYNNTSSITVYSGALGMLRNNQPGTDHILGDSADIHVRVKLWQTADGSGIPSNV